MREQVFALEQNCLYQDIDGLDVAAFHVLGYDEQNELVAYCRLLPPGKPYEGYYSIGRSTTKNGRGKGYGQLLKAVLELSSYALPIFLTRHGVAELLSQVLGKKVGYATLGSQQIG